MYIFVTGGYRSGRSNYGLRRASELGAPPWLYVSAGVEADEAITKRIERQRRDVEAIWRTAVMPVRLLDLVEPSSLKGYGAAVFDGFIDWLEGRVSAGAADSDQTILGEIEEVADRMYRSPVPIVLVSAEMGLGMPSDSRLLKVATSANQILAQLAAGVVLMVSGVPLKVR